MSIKKFKNLFGLPNTITITDAITDANTTTTTATDALSDAIPSVYGLPRPPSIGYALYKRQGGYFKLFHTR